MVFYPLSPGHKSPKLFSVGHWAWTTPFVLRILVTTGFSSYKVWMYSFMWRHWRVVCECTLRWSKKTSMLRFTSLCAGNSPVAGESPHKKASNAENVSIWWRHNALKWRHTSTLASQSTVHSTVCSMVYVVSPERKHQSSALLAFVWGIPSQRASNAENVSMSGRHHSIMLTGKQYIHFIL